MNPIFKKKTVQDSLSFSVLQSLCTNAAEDAGCLELEILSNH